MFLAGLREWRNQAPNPQPGKAQWDYNYAKLWFNTKSRGSFAIVDQPPLRIYTLYDGGVRTRLANLGQFLKNTILIRFTLDYNTETAA